MISDPGLREKNRRIGLMVALTVVFMVGLAFASVPLYRVFCRATGFNGTPTAARALPGQATGSPVTVNFNADISPDLDWDFRPEQQQIDIRPGQKALVSFRARNLSNVKLSGSAVYNVLPEKVGKYFHKIQCFCFSEQTLGPHQDVSMPVVFFVDPAFASDIDMQDVHMITLSYTFFRAETPALEQAVERFYNQPSATDEGVKSKQEQK